MTAPYNVSLPSSRTGFLPDLQLTSRSAGWAQVMDGPAGFRHDRRVRVPDFVFEEGWRVGDESAYRIDLGNALSPMDGPPEPGCVALVLESPHRDEFDGRGGRALGPLRNPAVRRELRRQLPALIDEAGHRLRETFQGRTIALVNAVQYQTSLQAIMRDYEGRLQGGVRTAVWKRIFEAGGAAEFEERLNRYEPRLVLLAPTSAVRDRVRSLVSARRRPWSWLEINYHPSYWGRSSPRLTSEVHRGGEPEASNVKSFMRGRALAADT